MQFKRRARVSTTLSITPLIDVVFLLLVFFMLTSTMNHEEAIELALPSATSSNVSNVSDKIINIKKSGIIVYENKVVDISKLKSKLLMLKEENSSPSVTIRADSDIPLSGFVEILDLLKSIDIKDTSIAVEKKA